MAEQPPSSGAREDNGGSDSDPETDARGAIRPWQILVGVLGIAVLVIVAILKLGGEGHGPGMHASGADANADPVDGAAQVTVTTTERDFEPERLELVAGAPVNLTLTNDDSVAHDWDLAEVGAHLHAEPGEEETQAVVVDDAGTYEAICTVPGHAEAGMTMTVEVRPENEAAPEGGVDHDDLEGLDEDELRDFFEDRHGD